VDDELRRELLVRSDEDQRIRNLVSSKPGGYMVRLPDELAAEWQRIDEENTRWLAEVLSARGWPGQALVGEDGAGAEWLLAQHADHDPSGSGPSCMPCAARPPKGRRRGPTWPTWRTGCGLMPTSLSCTAFPD
jgi:hypothetical protein